MHHAGCARATVTVVGVENLKEKRSHKEDLWQVCSFHLGDDTHELSLAELHAISGHALVLTKAGSSRLCSFGSRHIPRVSHCGSSDIPLNRLLQRSSLKQLRLNQVICQKYGQLKCCFCCSYDRTRAAVCDQWHLLWQFTHLVAVMSECSGRSLLSPCRRRKSAFCEKLHIDKGGPAASTSVPPNTQTAE